MDTKIGARGPVRSPEAPAPGRSGTANAPVFAVAAIVLYGLMALVVLPEGSPSIGHRLVALAAIAGASALTVVVWRWGPMWMCATGLLMVGFGMVTVFAGVVADRLLREVSVGAALGAVAGLGGAILIVAGWRRALRPIPRTWVRVAAAALGTFVVAQLLVLPGAVALLVTNRGRPVSSERTPADVGLRFQTVRVPVEGGLKLAGWWIPSKNGAAVILLHGSGSTRDDVLGHAKVVAEEGYGALLLDLRGHGESPGRIMDMGWGAERDVSAAVSWTMERASVERVGLLGLSMGGEIALTTAAVDPRVGAVIAEGATGRTWADTRVDRDPNPVAAATSWLQFALVEILAPEPRPMPMLDALDRIECRVLLIEGNGPMEQELGPRYARATSVTLWSLPDTPHTRALWTHPEGYRERILGLFDDALLPSG